MSLRRLDYDEPPFIALPVFLGRQFRHGAWPPSRARYSEVGLRGPIARSKQSAAFQRAQ
jgi:hypothetical protein